MSVKYQSQLKAIKTYRKGKKAYSIWYTAEIKARIDKELNKKGLKPREVFETGLKAAKISIKRKN